MSFVIDDSMSKYQRQDTQSSSIRLMSRSDRNFLFVLTLLGFLASLISTYVHYRLLTETEYLSFCDVSSTVSCTTVYLSRFGSFGGVPVALIGTIWFGMIMLLLIAERLGPSTYRASVPLYLFTLSGAASAVILYLAFASWFILGAICLLCVMVYLATIGIFVVSRRTISFQMVSLPGRAARDFKEIGRSPAASFISITFIAISALSVGFFSKESLANKYNSEAVSELTTPSLTDGQRLEFSDWYASQQRIEVPVDVGDVKLVIVKFNDYQCPPCGQTFFDYREILSRYRDEYPGEIVFVTKDYPIDPECNENVETSLHDSACEAAVAVRLARKLGQADVMEEWLFENQTSLSPQSVREAARDVAGVETFDDDYQATLELVKSDIALGRRLGVQSTPTFFVNGVRLRGGLDREYFEEVINLELKNVSE